MHCSPSPACLHNDSQGPTFLADLPAGGQVCSHSSEANPMSTEGGHWSLAGLTSPEPSLLHLKAIIANVTRWFPKGLDSAPREGSWLEPAQRLCRPGMARERERHEQRQHLSREDFTPGPNSTTHNPALNVSTLHSQWEVGEAILHNRKQ